MKTSTGKPQSLATSAPSDSKATTWPSALRAAFPLPSSTPVSVLSARTLDRTVLWVCRSWTKLSVSTLPSPATRLSASAVNATRRPSALIEADDRSVVAAGMVTSWRMEAAAQTSAEHRHPSGSQPADRPPDSPVGMPGGCPASKVPSTGCRIARQGRADRARCRPVSGNVRHPATARPPRRTHWRLTGCRQVSELLAEQASRPPKPLNTASVLAATDRVFWQISGKWRSEREWEMRCAWWS
jgi:hypothetical protein